jgi:erythrocyte band 7 integral membrane protein
MRQAAE